MQTRPEKQGLKLIGLGGEAGARRLVADEARKTRIET